jgi:hypothetical protein
VNFTVNTLDALNEYKDVDLGTNMPSVDDSYTVCYDYQSTLQCPNPEKPDRVGWIDVAIWTQHDAAGWVERRVDRLTHTANWAECNDTPSSGYDQITNVDIQRVITVSGLDANDDVRVKIKAVSGYGLGGEGFEIHCHTSLDDPPPGVAWYTATDSFATMTPDTEDLIAWEALAIV